MIMYGVRINFFAKNVRAYPNAAVKKTFTAQKSRKIISRPLL
ncbi:hypothetical protein FIC_01153 [Flavobacteriaceae bacterium 3519-10]|nr:hypothetical protein FIC_01153 [Flavobacteriaceae bacterium 3519-10]